MPSGIYKRTKPIWNKGIKIDREKYPKMGHFQKHSVNAKKKMSLTRIGYKLSEKTKKKIARAQTGISYISIKGIKKLSKIHLGSKNFLWEGGKSFEPYGLEFNEDLKEQIRKRDNYRCQECLRHQNELRTKTNRKYKLHIHHIDYNKQNNNPNNLISLCRNCHSQTNYNRDDWTNYFLTKKL